jgi:hypothetical protein
MTKCLTTHLPGVGRGEESVEIRNAVEEEDLPAEHVYRIIQASHATSVQPATDIAGKVGIMVMPTKQ